MLGINIYMTPLNFKYFKFSPNQLRSAFKLNRMRINRFNETRNLCHVTLLKLENRAF